MLAPSHSRERGRQEEHIPAAGTAVAAGMVAARDTETAGGMVVREDSREQLVLWWWESDSGVQANSRADWRNNVKLRNKRRTAL